MMSLIPGYTVLVVTLFFVDKKLSDINKQILRGNDYFFNHWHGKPLEDDIKSILQIHDENKSDHETTASGLFAHLREKYDWLSWTVIVGNLHNKTSGMDVDFKDSQESSGPNRGLMVSHLMIPRATRRVYAVWAPKAMPCTLDNTPGFAEKYADLPFALQMQLYGLPLKHIRPKTEPDWELASPLPNFKDISNMLWKADYQKESDVAKVVAFPYNFRAFMVIFFKNGFSSYADYNNFQAEIAVKYDRNYYFSLGEFSARPLHHICGNEYSVGPETAMDGEAGCPKVSSWNLTILLQLECPKYPW